MIDRILKYSFVCCILVLFFFIGFLTNELKIKAFYEGSLYILNDIDDRLNINRKKKFGDRDQKRLSYFQNIENLKTKKFNNFSGYNKPTGKFSNYLLIKHDNTTPVLMSTPDKVVWSWDLSYFRNSSKIIPYHMFKNGDLIIGKFETKGIYRIDKYGKIKWRLNKLNHHWGDIQNGKFYVPSRKFVSLPKQIPNSLIQSELKNCDYDKSAFDTLIILDYKSGRLIEEIDLMTQLSKDKNFINLINFKIKQNKDICKDPLHLNDVRKLNKNQIKLLKNKIKLSSNEIVILSFRSLDTVIFYDIKNNIINTTITDLFVQQHSPRLNSDGFLYVFDNNSENKESRIVKINLNDNSIAGSFSTKKFKSPVRGRIQFLRNNLYVQSSTQGEIFNIVCKEKFFNNCKEKYLYSANFSFFYPTNEFNKDFTFKKDGIYIGDFYEKNYVQFVK